MVLTLTNCEDNEKSPLIDAPNGAFVLIDIENTVIDVTDVENSTFGGTLRATNSNVASHEISVRSVVDGNASAFTSLYTTTTFPSDFFVTAGDIATALGVDVADFPPGTRFDFIGTTTDDQGNTVTINSLGSDLQSETGQRQAYDLQTFISCPFDVTEALGTYQVIDCGLTFCQGNTFEVIEGENPNEIIMVNPYGGSGDFNVVVQVNPTSGQITIEEQAAFNTEDTGNNGFEPTTIETESGFFFSCSGTITTNVDTSIVRISDGGRFTFGTRAFVAQKI